MRNVFQKSGRPKKPFIVFSFLIGETVLKLLQCFKVKCTDVEMTGSLR